MEGITSTSSTLSLSLDIIFVDYNHRKYSKYRRNNGTCVPHGYTLQRTRQHAAGSMFTGVALGYTLPRIWVGKTRDEPLGRKLTVFILVFYLPSGAFLHIHHRHMKVSTLNERGIAFYAYKPDGAWVYFSTQGLIC